MSAVDVVGWVAHLDGVGTSTVEEVDGYTIEATGIGGCEASREVGEQVDAFEVSLARSENTGDGNERSGVGGVVANDGGVDHQCQEGLLVVGSVVLEKCHGVWTGNTGLACVVVVVVLFDRPLGVLIDIIDSLLTLVTERRWLWVRHHMWHCGHTEQRAQAQDERLHDFGSVIAFLTRLG